MKNDDKELNENSENDARSSADDAPRDQKKDGENDLPPAEKLGERPDNLRRRSEWFQKRTGGR
jgi:hypothetical protein